jgi:hypothetical protein
MTRLPRQNPLRPGKSDRFTSELERRLAAKAGRPHGNRRIAARVRAELIRQGLEDDLRGIWGRAARGK